MHIRPTTADVWMLPCRARLPFRFGMHTMTVAPLATCRVEVEVADGGGGGNGTSARAVGYSSDLLVPKWFAKNPHTPITADWADLVAAQQEAIRVLVDGGNARADTAFGHWRRVYAERVEALPRDAADRLVRGEGVSLVERALIDAVCRHAGTRLHRALTSGALGFDAGALDSGISGWNAAQLATPRREIALRHTVGLVDAIERGDITEPVNDGLPECLADDIERFGLTHFKLKITSDADEQIDRLARVWTTIRRAAGEQARVTLDGNEQFNSIEQFAGVLARVKREDRFAGFLDALLLIEQPLARTQSFDAAAAAGMDRLGVPCIIDEADAGLWALPAARELGYRGVSIKSCKGVFSAILNRARCEVWNAGGGTAYFQSGEDLTTLPVLAVQQDLELMATLGVSHVERNGHHYFRGLGHLPERERRAAVTAHPDLYRDTGEITELRVDRGRLALGSVLDAAGFGYAGPVDLDGRVPAGEWDPGSLV